jgi:tetratricopeptide (TPR) repeat protein
MQVNNLGWGLLAADHDWEQAEKWMRRGYELDPSQGVFYAQVLLGQGRNDEAIDATRKAVERDPSNPNILASASLNYRLAHRLTVKAYSVRFALETNK